MPTQGDTETDNELKTWQRILFIVVGVLAVCCCCLAFIYCQKYRTKEAEAEELVMEKGELRTDLDLEIEKHESNAGVRNENIHVNPFMLDAVGLEGTAGAVEMAGEAKTSKDSMRI